MAIPEKSFSVLDKSSNAAIMLMVNYGVLIGWSIVLKPGVERWSTEILEIHYVIAHASFFMSAVLGTIFGLMALEYIRIRKLVFLSATLTLAGGIVKIILITTTNVNILACVFLSRSLCGFGFGCLYPIMIGQIGDQAHKEVRGRLTGAIPVAMECGIFLYLFYEFILGQYVSRMGIMAVHSILSAVAAFIYAYLFQIESYVDQIVRGDRDLAWNSFWRIRYQLPMEEVTKEFLEMEHMISDDLTQTLFQNINIVPYIFVIVTKLCVVIMSNNYMFNFMEHMLEEFTSDKIFLFLMWSLWIPRALTSSISLFFVDSIGRKKLFLGSCIATGICLLVIGILELTQYTTSILNEGLNWALYAIALCAQGCAGAGLIIVPDILIGEIIPYKLRKTSYIVIYGMEYIVKMTFLFTNGIFGYQIGLWILWSLIIILGGVLMRFSLPETRKQTIPQIRDILNKLTD